MSVTTTAKPLILSQFAENSDTIEYTAPSNTKSAIDKFTATNVTGGAVNLTVWIIPSGGTVGDQYKIIPLKSIPANSCVELTELKNHVLDTGGYIKVQAGAASSIVIRCSGREFRTNT